MAGANQVKTVSIRGIPPRSPGNAPARAAAKVVAIGEIPPSAKSHIRQILDALYDTVLILDSTGRILEVNGRAERQFGFRREELLNQPVSTMVQDFTPSVLAHLRNNLRAGKFTVIEGYCQARGKASFLAELTVGRLGENGAGRILLTLRNIERRKQTQEMLRAAHNALENAAGGIAITNTKGLIQRGNSSFSRIWEFSAARDVVGLDIRKLFGLEENVPPMIQQPMKGEIWAGELEARTRKGRAIHVQVSSAPNRDSRDRLIGMVFSTLDITARKKAEFALRREADAQIARAREANEFSGLLTALTVPDLVQLIASARKTGTLILLGDSGRKLASVSFANGETKRAECGERTGETAFFEMLRVEGREFRFEAHGMGEADDTIRRSTLGLLLEGVRLADEAGDRDRVESGESNRELPRKDERSAAS